MNCSQLNTTPFQTCREVLCLVNGVQTQKTFFGASVSEWSFWATVARWWHNMANSLRESNVDKGLIQPNENVTN